MKRKAILIVLVLVALTITQCKEKARQAPGDSKTVTELPADLIGQYCSAERCDRLELTVKSDYIDFLGVECIVEKVETSATFTTAYCKELFRRT